MSFNFKIILINIFPIKGFRFWECKSYIYLKFHEFSNKDCSKKCLSIVKTCICYRFENKLFLKLNPDIFSCVLLIILAVYSIKNFCF